MITLSIGPKILSITNNSVTEHYSYSDMKSVSPFYGYGNSGSFVLINFINENRNSSLKIPFELIDPSLGFTSVTDVVNAIVSAMGDDSTINLEPQPRSSKAFKNSDVGTINEKIHSIAFGNTGDTDVLVIIDSVGVSLSPGEVISFDAGPLNNTFSSSYEWDATGGEILITYVTFG